MPPASAAMKRRGDYMALAERSRSSLVCKWKFQKSYSHRKSALCRARHKGDYAASNLMPRGHLDFCCFHKNPVNSQLPDAA
jgi:hypothetical protein